MCHWLPHTRSDPSYTEVDTGHVGDGRVGTVVRSTRCPESGTAGFGHRCSEPCGPTPLCAPRGLRACRTIWLSGREAAMSPGPVALPCPEPASSPRVPASTGAGGSEPDIGVRSLGRSTSGRGGESDRPVGPIGDLSRCAVASGAPCARVFFVRTAARTPRAVPSLGGVTTWGVQPVGSRHGPRPHCWPWRCRRAARARPRPRREST